MSGGESGVGGQDVDRCIDSRNAGGSMDMVNRKCEIGVRGEKMVGGYMTVEAALVMSVVFMVYVFLIDTMIMQYERCVEELEGARKVVLDVAQEEPMYDVTVLDPVGILRLQRAVFQKSTQGEEKEECL